MAILLTALQNIDDYGDANATNLKQSVDDACQKKMTLTEETFKNSLVAMTAAGAYVNMGMCSGVSVQIQNDGRPWLIQIHWVSHRKELCIKDVFKTISTFQDLIDLMTSILYLMKRSGKFQQHFRDKTTVNFQYIYHIAFWLLENSTTLRAPNKCQI